MGKVNALWMDEMEARADALLAAGVDPADAWECVSGHGPDSLTSGSTASTDQSNDLNPKEKSRRP